MMDDIANLPQRRLHKPLRARILVAILVILGLALALLFGVSRLIVLRSFEDLEHDIAERNVRRALYALENDQAALGTIATDWAQWDDTGAFVQDANEAYIQSNLTPATFETLNLNVALIIDPSGAIVYGQGYDQDTKQFTPPPDPLLAHLMPGSPLLTHPDITSRVDGVIMLPAGPLLVSAAPILNSLATGPIQGTLVFGRYLDEGEIVRLAQVTYLALDLVLVSEADLLPDVKAALSDQRITVADLDDTLAGYALLDDVYGSPSLVLRVELPRDIYGKGQDTATTFALLILVLGLVFAGVSLFILERWVLARLARLSNDVQRIADHRDPSGRVQSQGEDELADLGTAINAMLDALDRSQQGLSESQYRLHHIVASIKDIIYSAELNEQGQVIAHWVLSAHVAELTGYPLEKFEADWLFWESLVQPEDLDKVMAHNARLRAGEDSEAEYRLITASGAVIWVRDSTHVERGPDGRVRYLFGVIHDITARKQVEDALAAERNLLRTLIDHLPDRVYVKDTEGRKLIANQADALAMGAFDWTEVVGQTDFQFYAPELAAQYAADDRAVMTSGQPLINHEEISTSHDSGERRILTSKIPLLDAHDQVVGLVGIGRDITDRHRVEEALRQSEERYRGLFDGIPVGVYRTTPAGEFLDANLALAQMLGYPDVESFMAMPVAEFYSNPRHRARWQAMIERTGVVHGFEIQARDRNDRIMWLRDTGHAVRDADGTVLYYEGSIEDITERKVAEQALLESEATNRSILAALPDLIFRLSREGQYLDARTGDPQLLIALPDDLIGSSLSDMLPAEIATRSMYYIQQALNTGEMQMYSYQLAVPAGLRDFESRLVVSGPNEVLAIVRDITERRQAEIERERLLHQMEIRAYELATVAEVSLQATTILDVDQLLWTVSNLTKDNFGLYHAHIYLLSADGQDLVLTAGAGDIGRQMVEEGYGIPVARERSLVARAARTRQTVIANNIEESPDFMFNPLLPDTQSEMAIPMVVGDDLLGVLDVQATMPGRFTAQDASIHQTLAAQVAIAIHNARLFTENARRLAIIENSDFLIALASLETRPTTPAYVNPAGLRMLGYTSLDDIAHLPVSSFYAPESIRRLRREARAVVRDQHVWQGESVLLRQDGSQVPVAQTVFVILDEHGQPRDLVTIASDITARKQAEEALQKVNRAYRTLSDCNQAMVRATDEAGLLDEVCQIIVTAGGYHMVWVGVVDEDGSVHPVTYSGHEDGYLDTLRPVWRSADENSGPTARAFRTRQPQLVRDIETEPGVTISRHEALRRGYRSAVVLPLIIDDEVSATLNVYASELDAFDAKEIDLLTELASDLAYGISALRTRAERQRAEQAEREQRILAEALRDTSAAINSTLNLDDVLERILANIERVMPHNQANIMLVKDGKARAVGLRNYARPELAEWVAGSVFVINEVNGLRIMSETKQPLIIPDVLTYPGWTSLGETHWIRSYAGAPILRDGEVIGFLNLDSEVPGFFQPDQADRLKTFADQAAIAIHNAQLFADEHDQRALAEALSDTATAINRTLDSEILMGRVLDNLKRVVPHDAANIMLIEDGVARAARVSGSDDHNLEDWLSRLAFTVDENPILRRVVETGQAVIIPTTDDEPGWERLPETGWQRSYAVVPIRRERVIGFLSVYSTTPGFFTPDHAVRLQAFADQAAIAIQNAQLFAAEHDQRILAEALSDTAAAISSTLNLEEVLERILTNIESVVPHQLANIMLVENGEARIVRYRGYTDPEQEAWIKDAHFIVDDIANLRQMARTGRPMAVPDTYAEAEWKHYPETYWMRSYAGAPILRDNEVIGFLNLDSTEPNFFSQQAADRLETFADQAAIAIHNARLFAAERDQRALAEALSDTAAVVSSSLNPDEVMERILENVGRVVPHETANIMLIEEGVARVVRARGYAERGLDDWIKNLRLEAAEVATWKPMLDTMRPYVIPDVAEDPGWIDLPEARWIRSSVKAPIRLEGDIVGILNLDSSIPGFFTARDARRLQAFADQAAAAIENARLYDAVQSYAHNLEQRVRERTAEVEAQRAQLQAILDAMGEGVVYSLGEQIIYTNQALVHLLGFEDTDTVQAADYLLDMVRNTPDLLEMLTIQVRKAFDRHQSWRGEMRLRRRDNIEIDAALTITQVPGADVPDTPGVVAIYRDISQDKALQAQKDRFIANASHELRTPLANIKTRLYLIQRQPEKLPAHLEVLGRVTDSMTELIENLLDVSRFERGIIPLYRQYVRLQEVIGDVVSIQQPEAERKDIALVAHLTSTPLTVFADPQRITQVITNLITNAINYTPEDGRITVELDQTPDGQAVIRVSDTGPGIPPDLWSQVFEPFFRANEGSISGTGLGLTITKEIVTLHGGDIFVDNGPDGGSVFTVLLDLVEEPPE